MAVMGVMLKCAFSESGEYFATLSTDGKLKVWETNTGVLKQEYTPNLHLSSPSTCLEWLKTSLETINPKRKKKKGNHPEESYETDAVAIGTASGSILLYGIARGRVTATLEGGPTSSVNCLSWCRGTNLFSCADDTILEWGVGSKSIKSKWKAGKDIVKCVLVLPNGNFILSASLCITLWSLPEHERLKTFTGHASDVTALVYVPPSSPSSESYFVSAASTDRYLTAWSLSTEHHKTSVAQFLMEDVATSVCVCPGNQVESTTMCAISRSGVSHLYKLQLNGKCAKPVKPKLTIQIASETTESEDREQVLPVPIVGALMVDPNIVQLAYGSLNALSFEKISPSYAERVLCLVRGVRLKRQRKITATAVMKPDVDVEATYINTLVGTSGGAKKRSLTGHCEVPMEERLNNLTLNRSDASSARIPQADNVAQLLIQGLRSKDRRVIDSVLLQKEKAVVERTIARLPVQVVVPLVQELTFLLQGKTMRSQVAALWLRTLIGIHSSQIISSPGATECLEPVLTMIETRLRMLCPLSKLRGRLDLLMEQFATSQAKSSEREDECLVYHDSYSSDDDSLADDKIVQSDSEDNWDDFSDPHESEMQDGENDAEMSVE